MNSLKSQAAGGVKWTSISAILNTVFQLALIAFLTRFLAKEDFGLMAIANIVIGFSQLFLDMGISNAIIYRENVTKKQLSSLYWLNVIIGIVFFFLLYLIAPAVALFYDEPRLESIINLIGVTFVIQPLGAQFAILLQKKLEFKSLAIRDISSKFTILVIGCILGYLGFGVYALVYSNLAGLIVATVLLVILGLPLNRPKLRFKIVDIKPFLSFGLFQMGEKAVNYFNTQLDGIIIGKLLGLEALGVYNLAKTLVMKPAQIINPIITKVSFPVMAKVNHDFIKLRSIYLKTLRLTSAINFPIFIFVAFFAEPIVLLFFGSEWPEVVIILRILSVYYLIRSTDNPRGSLLLATGRASIGFYWNLALLLIIPPTIYFGSFWGVMGVSYSFVILQLVLSIPGWYFVVKRICHANFLRYYSSFRNSMVLSLIANSLAFGMVTWIGNISSIAVLCISASITATLLLILYNRFNKEVVQEFAYVFLKSKKIKTL